MYQMCYSINNLIRYGQGIVQGGKMGINENEIKIGNNQDEWEEMVPDSKIYQDVKQSSKPCCRTILSSES